MGHAKRGLMASRCSSARRKEEEGSAEMTRPGHVSAPGSLLLLVFVGAGLGLLVRHPLLDVLETLRGSLYSPLQALALRVHTVDIGHADALLVDSLLKPTPLILGFPELNIQPVQLFLENLDPALIFLRSLDRELIVFFKLGLVLLRPVLRARARLPPDYGFEVSARCASRHAALSPAGRAVRLGVAEHG